MKATRLYNDTPYTVTLSWANSAKDLPTNSFHHFEDGGFELPRSGNGFVIAIQADDVYKATGYVTADGHSIWITSDDGQEDMYVRSTTPSTLIVLRVGVLISTDNARTGIVIGDWEVAPHN